MFCITQEKKKKREVETFTVAVVEVIVLDWIVQIWYIQVNKQQVVWQSQDGLLEAGESILYS